MNFYSYKIFEKVNGYYFYFISHIDHTDLNFNICESYADAFPDVPINQYFNIITDWSEDADIEKCDNISPIQVINKQFPTNDVKNMNVSNDFEKVLNEALEALKIKRNEPQNQKLINQSLNQKEKQERNKQVRTMLLLKNLMNH